MRRCRACGAGVEAAGRIGRRETCRSCGADLHCCLNCSFYAPGSYNDCRESGAERVIEKAKSNFCDYFVFRGEAAAGAAAATTAGVKAQLEELFRKKHG